MTFEFLRISKQGQKFQITAYNMYKIYQIAT